MFDRSLLQEANKNLMTYKLSRLPWLGLELEKYKGRKEIRK